MEFVNGGWVQHDEACPLYNDFVDQTTRGHLWLKKHLNVVPTVGWQLDPFGHSNAAAVMSVEAGLTSVFFGRSDYRELKMRYANSSLEYIWRAGKSRDTRIFASQLYGQGKYGGYYSWFPFEETNARDRNYVQDDPTMQDYNVKEWVDRVVGKAIAQGKQTQTSHQLWMLGNDFTFQSASRWFANYDKLIKYVNADGRIRLLYSTPSRYVREKAKQAAETNVQWELRKDDLFPLGDGPHEYWTGYFTSRVSLKRQYRQSANLLRAARQIESFSHRKGVDDVEPCSSQVDSERKPSSPLGIMFSDDLEGAMAVLSHHDGVTGTARQSVTNDYANRLSLGSQRAESASLCLLGKLAGIAPGGKEGVCNCNTDTPQSCLNMTSCAFTTQKNRSAFSVVLWNPLAWDISTHFEIPVYGGLGWSVSLHNGTYVPFAVVPLDSRVKLLSIMYLNDFGMNHLARWDAKRKLENAATHKLVFRAYHIPATGHATFSVKRGGKSVSVLDDSLSVEFGSVLDDKVLPLLALDEGASYPRRLESDHFIIELDSKTGALTHVTNKQSKKRYRFEIEWGYYKSSVGGCTKEKPELDACSSQASGAYLFRPNGTDLFWKSSVPNTTQIKRLGSLGWEITQRYTDFISHTLRFHESHLVVDWIVGSIPIEDGWGKEVVVRYRSAGFHSNGKFSTDSNGRETVTRYRNKRSSAYPRNAYKSLKYEPVSSNYYPVTAFIAIENDQGDEMAVCVDASQGGTSLNDGEIELMVHRRVLVDDYRGVEEPLNETMCGCGDINAPPGQMGVHGHLGDGGCSCVGLAIRGKHAIILDRKESVHEKRRLLSAKLAFPVHAFFYENAPSAPSNIAKGWILKSSLPPNIELLTYSTNYENGTLVRLSHIFEAGEHSEYSKSVTLKLDDLFFRKITKVRRVSLTGNQDPLDLNLANKAWRVEDVPYGVEDVLQSSLRSAIANDWKSTTLQLVAMETVTYWIDFEK